VKRTIILSYIALFAVFLMPQLIKEDRLPVPIETPVPTEQISPSPSAPIAAEPAPKRINVLTAEGIQEMDMQEYLVGVLAAEMPASFELEALKAQAVAARTYAIYTANEGGKHGENAVCTSYACCQAWHSETQLRENWGADYDRYIAKIQTAVAETAGEYLASGGEPVFAAFHSSSAGLTENSSSVWGERPYLVSVSSPETAEDVPNFVSRVDCAAIDFRDTILYAHPEADFTGEESAWIGEISREESGRVASAVLGGVSIKGTELRKLFKLRSTAFELRYAEGVFSFIVTGNGHGVGMSQYGANVMAKEGADYTVILAHYYTDTELVRS